MTVEYTVFQGRETRHRSAQPDAWYWAPSDYEGDVLWSEPYDTREQAETAARESMPCLTDVD